MKNGLLVYPDYYNLFNVGDYIQSIAANQFFDKGIDHYLCREKLASYAGNNLRLIMNGWFTHETKNWRPASRISPLFISFHINSTAAADLTDAESIKYFKQHEPIGCRDRYTRDLLTKKGVKAYFSGCLTLTLGLTYHRKDGGGQIYFVDPYFELKKNLLSLLRYCVTAVTNFKTVEQITKRKYGNRAIKSIIKATAFFDAYRTIFDNEVLTQAIYIEQELSNDVFDDDDQKFEYADSLLRNYSSAKFVVTSRIHCALPCLGIGTPVLYVNNVDQAETSECRLNGLLELFHTIEARGNSMSSETVGDKKIGRDFSFYNKNLHFKLKESLIKTAQDFVNTETDVAV